jgi:hypothetical protein
MKQTRKNINKNQFNKTYKNRVFTKSDYNSGDGMLTTVWGPSMWHFLHVMSFNYPIHPTKEDKIHYRNFIISLKYILPCKYCRINLTKNLKQLPITMQTMKNRDSFSRYIYNLHELVNKMLNKKSDLTYNDVRERYEHFRSRCLLPVIPIPIKKINKKEKGCTEPLYGKKSKCIIKIVPQDNRSNSFQMDKKCFKSKTYKSCKSKSKSKTKSNVKLYNNNII